VVQQDDDQVIVQCDQADTLLQVRHSQPLVPGMAVTVALRPEKMRLIGQITPDAPNQVRGIIKEIAYLGDVSIYHVELGSGKRVQFTQSNVQALAEQPLSWDEEVLLGWSANSCGVLTE
jgi:putrescine transport system ATP-binding protein